MVMSNNQLRQTEDRRCTRCAKTKPITDFAINSKSLGGRRTVCKPCVNTRKALLKPLRHVPCSQEGCGTVRLAKGLCSTHYYRLNNGMPLDKPVKGTPRKALVGDGYALIPMGYDPTDGFIIVDPEFAYLDKYLWSMGNYPRTQINKGENKTQIQNLIIGYPPKGMMIDHINRVRYDNRRANLRFVTPKENANNKDWQAVSIAIKAGHARRKAAKSTGEEKT